MQPNSQNFKPTFPFSIYINFCKYFDVLKIKMTRKCSHCSNNGHNSRTCSSRGGCVKLFGVRLTDGCSIIKKSASMGNLSASQHYHSYSLSPSPSLNFLDSNNYLSDVEDPSSSHHGHRKKGIPWNEEEHRMFLLGLQKLGKGDWRGISRNFVVSRTPTQVASHAQKYFIRQTTTTSRRKRRSSLFDIASDKVTPTKEENQFTLSSSDVVGTNKINLHHDQRPSLDLTLKPNFGSIKSTHYKNVEETNEIVPPLIYSFLPTYIPPSLPLCPSNAYLDRENKFCHCVVKPIPILAKEHVYVDEVVGMSKLNIRGTETGDMDPSLVLSLRQKWPATMV